eukprot:TRINITY_DN19576_c0_g1_i1.p1 TRINITY_DN19576_c0_g1~~TRINITY_DN19576_c0_g1_i1.p1  ORF type:complete len:397 (+),score=47.01 TRINITY_DN19576_c0_g1_i1:157-1191(+)
MAVEGVLLKTVRRNAAEVSGVVYKQVVMTVLVGGEDRFGEAGVRQGIVEVAIQMSDEDEKLLVVTELVRKVQVMVPLDGENRTVTWEGTTERSNRLVLAIPIPLNYGMPDGIVISVAFSHDTPHYRLSSRNKKLKTILHEVYGLRGAGADGSAGSTSHEIFTAFCRYIKDTGLLQGEGPTAVAQADELLEDEFGCKKISLTALRANLHHREADCESFHVPAEVSSNFSVQIPFPVSVRPPPRPPKPPLDTLPPLLDTGKQLATRIATYRSLAAKPLPAIESIIASQSRLVRALTGVEPAAKKMRQAERDEVWRMPVGHEALVRYEKHVEAGEVRRLMDEKGKVA